MWSIAVTSEKLAKRNIHNCARKLGMDGEFQLARVHPSKRVGDKKARARPTTSKRQHEEGDESDTTAVSMPTSLTGYVVGSLYQNLRLGRFSDYMKLIIKFFIESDCL